MFVPLHDNTPLKVIRFQFVTGVILFLSVAAFAYTHVLVGGAREMAIATGLGVVPALITDNATLAPALRMVPEPVTLVSYVFLHAGWLHLIANMAFLWVFADNIEDAFGHTGFLMFFLICGIAAGLSHAFMTPTSQAPLVGASGAVAGVLGSYLVLFPKARVWILLFLRIPFPVPAWLALVGWFAVQVVSLFIPQTGEVVVAWWAHIGGFATGLALTLVFKRWLARRVLR